MSPQLNFVDSEIPSPSELWESLVRNAMLRLECVLPATVVSYDRAKNLVTVQPAVHRVLTDGTMVPRAIAQVPCANFCGGGVGINFPLKPGDTGWLIAADRDTENFQQALSPTIPKSGNIHRYEFGVFIPDKIRDFIIDTTDEGALVIETLDSKTRLSLKQGQITIISANNVKVVTKTADVTASDKVTLACKTATVTATDSASVTCPATTWTGNITVTGDVVANGISLTGHVHPQTTSANTLPPI